MGRGIRLLLLRDRRRDGHGPRNLLALSAEGKDAGSDQAPSYLDEDQQKLLAALESSVEKQAGIKSAAVKGRRGKAKSLHHQLHRKPTATQQARWEAVQLARDQGLSLRAIAREL